MSNSKLALTKIFTSIFDTPLFARGFKRKGTLYYRMNGNILQGVVLTKTSPYIIRYNMFPYWTYGSECRFGELDAESLKHGGWAEGKLSDIGGVYYNAESASDAIDDLNNSLHTILDTVMPMFDIAKDEFSYFAAMVSLGKMDGVPQKALLRMAFLQKDFGLAETVLKYRRLNAKLRCYFEPINNYAAQYIMANSTQFENIGKVEQYKNFKHTSFNHPEKTDSFVRNYHYNKRLYFDLLEEKIQEQDLLWIDSIYQTDCDRVAKMLREALNLDI